MIQGFRFSKFPCWQICPVAPKESLPGRLGKRTRRMGGSAFSKCHPLRDLSVAVPCWKHSYLRRRRYAEPPIRFPERRRQKTCCDSSKEKDAPKRVWLVKSSFWAC